MEPFVIAFVRVDLRKKNGIIIFASLDMF
jgi:hypothetical protein